MTTPTVALHTDSDVTDETIHELFTHVDTDTASADLLALTQAVIDNPNDTIDTGERNTNRDKDDPCPECGAERLYFEQIVSDTYLCTGEETVPGGSSEIIESTVLVECTECGETLYRQPGI